MNIETVILSLLGLAFWTWLIFSVTRQPGEQSAAVSKSAEVPASKPTVEDSLSSFREICEKDFSEANRLLYAELTEKPASKKKVLPKAAVGMAQPIRVESTSTAAMGPMARLR